MPVFHDRYFVTVTMKPETVRLFIKPHCGWCHDAMAWLDQRGISYDKRDVVADSSARKEMIALSGQTLTPVIDADGEVLANFGADELAEWWEKQGFGSA